MILKYSFATRTATLVGYDGTRFEIPYKIANVEVPNRMGKKITGLFDWKTLMTEERIIISTTADEATAALKMIEQWPDCDEKSRYIPIIKRFLSADRDRRRENYISGMMELYGKDRGLMLSNAIHNNELPGIPGYFLREEAVANLINFLVDEVCGLASYSTPTPNNNLNAMRACQFFVFSKAKAPKLRELLLKIEADCKVRVAFVVAKYLEDRI